nr:zinc-binding dehydrogenase [Verrucomicrobium spinosum]
MNRAIVQNNIQPVLDRTFAFEEAPAAFEHMAAGAHFGKIVVSGS